MFRKILILYIILITIIYNSALYQNNNKNFLKKLGVSQVGEFTGWFGVMIGFRLIDVVMDVKFNSIEQKNKFILFSGNIIGNLTSNHFLKHYTKRDTRFYFKNVLFSSVPTIIYLAIYRPDFNTERFSITAEEKIVGFIGVTLLITPIFAVIGEKIYGSSAQKEKKLTSSVTISPVIIPTQEKFFGVHVMIRY